VATSFKHLLGAVIRARRKELGLTQRDLADRVNVSESQTVSRWERGERAPTDLEAVAKGLEWSTEELLRAIQPLKQHERRMLDPRAGTQLDRIEAKLDAILGQQRERDEAVDNAITELRAGLATLAADSLQRTRKQVRQERRDTGR
jgi:transcriptional regulator with XRE-family HTH domain